MPYAIAHILITIIILDLIRDHWIKNKKKFPLYYVLIGGIAGLLPDLDVAIYYILGFFGFTLQQVHRTFTHNLFFLAVFVILGLIFNKYHNKELGKHHLKLGMIFFVISFGIFTHLALDATISGNIKPLYPLSQFTINFGLLYYFPGHLQSTIIQSIEAIILILWLAHEGLKHKISDFI
jgi:membrane-bound metal-dependent hydrolase YbcI (DUF457 family)